MYFSSLPILSLLAASGAGVPFPSTIVHEKRSHVPSSWIKRDRVNSSVLMPARIGMTQSNLNRGYDMLMQVSQYDSPNYGKHYSAEEVADIFAPSKSTVEAVSDWLLSAGIAKDKISQSLNKQWMQFDVLAEDLESLLNTEYHVYEHSLTGASDIACEKYHVPAHVQEHIDYITPGIRLLAPARKTSQARNEKRTFGITTDKGKSGFLQPLSKPLGMPIKELLAASELQLCNVAITPACIKALYNITEPTKATPGNELGIFEDLGDVYSQADLNLFFETLAQNIPQDTHPILEAIDGGVAPGPVSYAGAESTLDIQISYPLIYPQNSILFQTDDPVYESNYTYQGFLNNFLYAIDGSYCSSGLSPLDPQYPDTNPGGYNGSLQCGVYKAPNVLSISYGGQEADLPISYQQRQCNEFMKLGMQGISVVVSSGDVGVAGPPGDVNRNGCLGNGTIFSPDFPATCPYITTVGGTYLPPNGTVQASSEIAVSRFPSGGGFSNIYPSPSYQSSTIQNYLTTFPPPYKSYSGANNESFGANGGIYNKAGRAYPDVSAIGDNVLIFNEGYTMLIGGTSASTPVWASILTRINEERIAAGKGTVGFVNPVLYAHPEVLNDITVGSNPGCGTDGFAVTEGWDPVTGLGTPNYPALLDLFMSL